MYKLSTINLHLTDKCNYNCKFCFVNKQNHELSLEQAKYVVDKVKRYFDLNKMNGRINLVGGEPLCYKNIQELIDYINSKNIDVSIVTNASLLTKKFILDNKNKLKMIGISVDSLNRDTNYSIGRCSNQKVLQMIDLIKLCKIIKSQGIKLKINTCVMKLNLNEDLSSFIKLVQPDRYKIFQVVPDTLFGYQNRISLEEFNNYLLKYKGIKYKSETSEYMKDNYLIIDSLGKLTINNRHQ